MNPNELFVSLLSNTTTIATSVSTPIPLPTAAQLQATNMPLGAQLMMRIFSASNFIFKLGVSGEEASATADGDGYLAVGNTVQLANAVEMYAVSAAKSGVTPTYLHALSIGSNVPLYIDFGYYLG